MVIRPGWTANMSTCSHKLSLTACLLMSTPHHPAASSPVVLPQQSRDSFLIRYISSPQSHYLGFICCGTDALAQIDVPPARFWSPASETSGTPGALFDLWPPTLFGNFTFSRILCFWCKQSDLILFQLCGLCESWAQMNKYKLTIYSPSS